MEGNQAIINILARTSVSVGKEILTVSNTAVGFTIADMPASANYAIVQVGDAPIRYWTDGSIPTSTEGVLRDDKDIFDVLGAEDLQKFKAIRTTATDATLQIIFYKI